jgi:3-dehydroquinate dehydratase/shikimate dehydrogenase
MATLETTRLILRPWKDSDFEPFAALCADPRVMQYFPAPLTHTESLELAKKIQSKIEKRGWGLWAVTLPNIADFIGYIGLNDVDFLPSIEIGWRLAFPYWGKGYATEGALAALHYGFTTLNLDEIISFTVPANTPSRRVMEKIGMSHNSQDDFLHPKLPPGHPLQPHVLYRLPKSTYLAQNTKNDKNDTTI